MDDALQEMGWPGRRRDVPPTGSETRTILEEMRAGRRAGFDRFFERYAPRILVYICYNLGPRLRAKIEPEDILQEVYAKVFENFESFLEKARVRGVARSLIRLADHRISEAYRYHYKVERRDARREVAAGYADDTRTGSSPLDLLPAQGTSVSRRLIRHEEVQRILGLFRELTPLEQYITVAQVFEGLSSEEIGELTGKSPGAVRMILSRVRDKLHRRAGPLRTG